MLIFLFLLFVELRNRLFSTRMSAVKLHRGAYITTSFMLPGLSRYLTFALFAMGWLFILHQRKHIAPYR